ncbi:hypothetical protein [Rhodovibrio salinarum]|uniref:Uncharacterized protein n=1 Tax=Rhodovibrio salinarum TaxID=1087 RepID=A0A934QHW4_9PROT|nr:hypothetical protein [Rhodovibrio salinarum]MBK1697174.1 hypothetical protein [Rhodovibrio salinarum]
MFGKLFGKKGAAGQTPVGPPDLSRVTETGGAFFVPGVDDAETARARLTEARERLARPLKAAVGAPAYAALEYTHEQDSYRSAVGALDPRLNETVRAILRQDAKYRFLILTDRHGFDAGLPLIVSDREVTRAVAFKDG